jgi:group I intron endonuclease
MNEELFYGYIYLITNSLSGKIYIGKKKGKPEDTESYYGSGRIITAAIKKYGKENFTKKILELCTSIEDQNIKEIKWISELKSTDILLGYNISKGGDFGDVFTNNPNKELIREKIRASKIGVKHPKWRCILKSKSQAGRKRVKSSEETKNKMSVSQKKLYTNGYISPVKGRKSTKKELDHNRQKNFIEVDQYSRDGLFIKSWISPCIVQEKLNIARTNIVNCCKGKRKTAGNYIWRYRR